MAENGAVRGPRRSRAWRVSLGADLVGVADLAPLRPIYTYPDRSAGALPASGSAWPCAWPTPVIDGITRHRPHGGLRAALCHRQCPAGPDHLPAGGLYPGQGLPGPAGARQPAGGREAVVRRDLAQGGGAGRRPGLDRREPAAGDAAVRSPRAAGHRAHRHAALRRRASGQGLRRLPGLHRGLSRRRAARRRGRGVSPRAASWPWIPPACAGRLDFFEHEPYVGQPVCGLCVQACPVGKKAGRQGTA